MTMKKGIPKFRSQLITMTMVTCICSILVLGITLILIFIHTFSKNAREDIEFYLENTTDQFDLRMQYLEDIIIALRHNENIKSFFTEELYDRQEASKQLSYSGDLFAARNMVDSSYPFVERIYLFNQSGDWVSNYFYPATLAETGEADAAYREMNERFRRTGTEYSYVAYADEVCLCMWIYDENMKAMGNCMVSFGIPAWERVFGNIQQYDGFWWLVTGTNGQYLAGSPMSTTQAEDRVTVFHGIPEGISLSGGELVSRKDSGFGMKSCVSVSAMTVYDSINSTVCLFAMVFLIVLGIAAVTVFYISYSFTKPLKAVADKIRSFGGGNFDTRLEGFKTEEFNDISVVFNEMTEQMNHLITEVYEKQLLATQSQVRFLQSQINPHFMFNILSMISMRAGLGGDTEVQKLLTAFSKLLQGKIFRSGEILIPLSEELELVDFYLYLQSNRFSGKINYEIQCEEGLEEEKIPRLCIEPLVENAVSHGLEPKAGTGTVRIVIWKHKGRIWIRVEDDGEGFDVKDWRERQGREKEDEAKGDNKMHTRVGLCNTEKLLHIFYEDASMNVESSPGEGTRVTLILPVAGGEEEGICGE